MALDIILATIYFFIPAYVANAIPPLLNRFKILESLAIPIDNHKTLRQRAIFGSHKTWRGAMGIIIAGTLFTVLFFALNNSLRLYEIIGFDYLKWNPFVFGIIYSLGIIIGDLLFAFVKRQLYLSPGAAFVPFDQTNYVFGVFMVLQYFINLDLSIWAILLIQTFIIHVVFNRLGYTLGLHNAKW